MSGLNPICFMSWRTTQHSSIFAPLERASIKLKYVLESGRTPSSFISEHISKAIALVLQLRSRRLYFAVTKKPVVDRGFRSTVPLLFPGAFCCPFVANPEEGPSSKSVSYINWKDDKLYQPALAKVDNCLAWEMQPLHKVSCVSFLFALYRKACRKEEAKMVVIEHVFSERTPQDRGGQ